MEVLGDVRGFAVGHAVLAQVTGPEPRRRNLERAALGERGRWRRPAALPAPAAARRDRPRAVADLGAHGVLTAARRALPVGARKALPRRLAARRLRGAELEQPRLRA